MAKPIVSRPPKRASQRQQIEAQRQQLFHASAIIGLARGAAASKLIVQETDFVFGLAIAGRLIDDVAAALEVHTTSTKE